MKRVIAIDGPSGAGKSTIAKRIAELTGFAFLDTGALYRAVALGLLREGFDEGSDDVKISQPLKEMSIKYDGGSVLLNGQDVSTDIRDERISHYSSIFSAMPIVRAFLMDVQRNCAMDSDIVAEGRDMTTVVFKDAMVKFFLIASQKIRALRRYEQIKEKFPAITIEQIERDILVRDRRDTERDIAPLLQAKDAILIDSSQTSIEETAALMMKVINERL